MKLKLLNARIKNIITFSSIGAAAYILADIIHEVIGHSCTCILAGHKITLLTSVYFRSIPGSIFTDLGGPASNLIFGFLIYYILIKKKNLPVLLGFLLLLTMSYNFFWFSGTILQSSFSPTGDWTYAAKGLNIGLYAKPFLAAAGIAAYYFFIRVVKTQYAIFKLNFPAFPLKLFIYISYFAAVAAAVIAGLFYYPGRMHAAFEGLLEMIGSLPVLFIGIGEKFKYTHYKTNQSPIFNILIFAVFIVFCLTLGRGFIL